MATTHRGALAWSRLIVEWRGSGLSLPEFCRRRGIKKTTMSGWVYKPDLKRAIETARRVEADTRLRTRFDCGNLSRRQRPSPSHARRSRLLWVRGGAWLLSGASMPRRFAKLLPLLRWSHGDLAGQCPRLCGRGSGGFSCSAVAAVIVSRSCIGIEMVWRSG